MPNSVLVISYYWPPSGGGGVQRWLKFSKYLPQLGWQTTVFTPENPEFELKDESLNQDIDSSVKVLKFPIWEPFSIYKKIFSKKSDDSLQQGVVIEKSKLSSIDRLVIWIRGNIFIPDPRKFWVKPSVAFLKNYIAENNIDVIITTGPPHSMHLIGLGLKKSTSVKWIADFRDPWLDWDILDKLRTSKLVRRLHQNMESKVLNSADAVLTVTPKMGELFAAKSDPKKIHVITNGMDEDDFVHETVFPDKFRITHLGLLNELRDPVKLWEVLNDLCDKESDFSKDLEIFLSGNISRSVLDRIDSFSNLKRTTVIHDYIAHDEVFRCYSGSSILLLLTNQTKNSDWLIPGKLFEYFGVKREIMAFGSSNSDVHDILISSGGEGVLDYQDESKIKERILTAYRSYKEKKIFGGYTGVEKFYRKKLTGDLSELLLKIKNQKT